MNTTAHHQGLANGRWQTLTLSEQLGNIGSEIDRAASWQERKNIPYRDAALERALELFDLTLADSRWKKRLKEIARAREVVCDFFYGNNTYDGRIEDLRGYFLPFAIHARKI